MAFGPPVGIGNRKGTAVGIKAFDFSTTGEAGNEPWDGWPARELMPKCSGAEKAPAASAFLCLFHTRGGAERRALRPVLGFGSSRPMHGRFANLVGSGIGRLLDPPHGPHA